MAVIMQSSVAKKGASGKSAHRNGGARTAAGLTTLRRAGLKRPRSQKCLPRSGARPRTAAPAPDAEAEKACALLQTLRAVVINLDRRPDRMEGCAARLAQHCAGLRFSHFSATDGRQTCIGEAEVATSWNTARNVVYQKLRSVRKGWDDLDTYQVRQLGLSPGERGCASSHIRAWRRCLELAGDSQEPLLVLEDDAAPTPEFGPRLRRALAALPPDAHLLYLGYSQAAEWRRELSPELVESKYVWTTVGYMVWPAGARLLLSKLPVNEPVDNWMAALCAEDDVKAYCVRPKIVHQADAWNVNSDVAHSDEHYWGPDSDIKHSEPTQKDATPGAPLVEGSCFWDIDSEDSEDSSDDL